MKRVIFDPRTLEGRQRIWWDKWEQRATAETRAIVARWEQAGRLEPKDFKSTIWSDLKSWLLENVFNGKCAYCETKLRQARQPGHAEHFRPKAAVRCKITVDGNAKLVPSEVTLPDGTKIVHPGYFWLAYRWENVLPSCNDCNTGQGKNNQFPVRKAHALLTTVSTANLPQLSSGYVASYKWPDHYYLGPQDLEKEEGHLLLHPYFDEPRDHIMFGISGIEAARQINGTTSERGLCSIEVYELNASELRRARHDQQSIAWNQYFTAYHQAVNNGQTPEQASAAAHAAIAQRLGVNPPYSVAVEDFINLYTG